MNKPTFILLFIIALMFNICMFKPCTSACKTWNESDGQNWGFIIAFIQFHNLIQQTYMVICLFQILCMCVYFMQSAPSLKINQEQIYYIRCLHLWVMTTAKWPGNMDCIIISQQGYADRHTQSDTISYFTYCTIFVLFLFIVLFLVGCEEKHPL